MIMATEKDENGDDLIAYEGVFSIIVIILIGVIMGLTIVGVTEGINWLLKPDKASKKTNIERLYQQTAKGLDSNRITNGDARQVGRYLLPKQR